jgi:hypothetical protein
MPSCDDAETATGHHPIRSLSSAPGHVIATGGVAVSMSIAARGIVRLEAGLATSYLIHNDRTR